MPLRGYSRLPGKSERYRTPKGTVISRRQYENVKHRRAGWRSWSEAQRTAKRDPMYNRMRAEAMVEHGLSKRQTGLGSEFQERYLKAKQVGFDETDEGRDPEGAFADLLSYVGLRDPEDHWDVGDTPQGE